MSGELTEKGACLCGAVRFSVRILSTSIGACHCSMCRTWGGGPLLAVRGEADATFEGADQISKFSSSDWAERGFCSTCGTHLFYRLKLDGHYAIPVGLLPDAGPWEFDEQIFVDEQPAYYSFANDTKKLTGAEVFAEFASSGD